MLQGLNCQIKTSLLFERLGREATLRSSGKDVLQEIVSEVKFFGVEAKNICNREA
jgi:hypothetical protein